MARLTRWFSVAMLLLAVGVWAGCGDAKKPPEKKPVNKPDEHEGHNHEGHDHHDHAHAHGPNGGHIVELDSAAAKGKEDIHAEWVHDDESGKVTVYLLGEDMKKEVGTDAEVLSIDIKTEEGLKTHILKAANRTDGDNPTATRFELVDQALVTILAGEGIDAKIRVDIKGTEFSGKIEHHKH